MNKFMKLIISIITVLTLAHCASVNQDKTVRVGRVTGSVDFRIIGSYGQVDNPQQVLDAAASIPVSGVPVPLAALLNKAGADSQVSIDITEIGKDFTLEIIGTGIQNTESYTIETKSEKIRVGGTTDESISAGEIE